MKNLALLITVTSLLTACGEVSTPPTPITSSPAAITPSTSLQNYTTSDIIAHNKTTDCWMIIHDKVYNVTSFVSSENHPGGPVISQGCGKDATTLFEDRPGEGTPHSSRAKEMLPAYHIGNLKK